MNLCSIHTSIQMRDKATLQPAQVQELSSNSVLQNLKPVLEADGKAGLIVYSTGFHDRLLRMQEETHCFIYLFLVCFTG